MTCTAEICMEAKDPGLLSAPEHGAGSRLLRRRAQSGHVCAAWLPQGNVMPGAGWPTGQDGCRCLLAALSQGGETVMQSKSSQHAVPHRLPARSCLVCQ